MGRKSTLPSNSRALLVLERGSQHGAVHAQTASRGGAVGDVAARDRFAVDREGGTGAEGRRVVRSLRRRGHDGRESPADEARGRRVAALGQAAASRR